jgi:hypothetical protein
MGLMPDVKGMIAKLDERFMELKAILESILAELKSINSKTPAD